MPLFTYFTRGALLIVAIAILSTAAYSQTKLLRFPDIRGDRVVFTYAGDQAGHLSCAPDESVKFRVGPFSIGAVKMSPRAANNARSPFGLSPTDSIRFPAATRLGLRELPSSGTLIEIGVLFFVFASSTWSSPFNS